MKLAASIFSTLVTVGSTFKISNEPFTDRKPLPRPSFKNMPYTRRTACPNAPVRHGQGIPGFENRSWNLSEIFRKRMNRKIDNFQTGQCDTMFVRIQNDDVIDICFHYEWEIGNPLSMETTCVNEKYREIDCYMGTSPFALMSKSCEAKEEMPLFLSPSLMYTSLGALLFDFEPSESSSESSGPELYGPETDSNGPESFGPLDDASSGLRRQKREVSLKMKRMKSHQKRHS